MRGGKWNHIKLPQSTQLRLKLTNCLTFNRFMAAHSELLPHATWAIPQSYFLGPARCHLRTAATAASAVAAAAPTDSVNDCSSDDALVKNARPAAGQTSPHIPRPDQTQQPAKIFAYAQFNVRNVRKVLVEPNRTEPNRAEQKLYLIQL